MGKESLSRAVTSAQKAKGHQHLSHGMPCETVTKEVSEPALIQIKHRSEAQLPSVPGFGLWLLCTSLMMLHGARLMFTGQIFSGGLVLLFVVTSVYYVGRGLRLRRAIENAPCEVVPSSSVETVIAAVPVSARAADGVCTEVVYPPVTVVPTAKLLLPKRWLVVQRKDGISFAFAVPDLLTHQGWWCGWMGGYLRRDTQGFYVCPGHPDDQTHPDRCHRLFEEVPVDVCGVTLLLTGTGPPAA